MLIEKKSTEILSLCDELDKLQKKQRNARDFNNIEKELRAIVEGIEPFSKTVIALANELKNNVANSIPKAPKEVARFLDAALKIAADNELELETIDLPRIRFDFNRLRDQLIKRANDDWITLQNQHVPWPEDLLVGLESIGLRTVVKSLRNCEHAVQNTTRNLPKGKGDIETFLLSVKQYQLATKEIDLPESIKNFLQDATRGVPLDSFDSEVHSWLQEHNLINKFAIRFA